MRTQTLEQFKKVPFVNSARGFTIVELLIVIVVIGILAAIVIVAYQGVTSRAKTSQNQTTASYVQKKAEAYNSDTSTNGGNGFYPATATIFNAVPNGALGDIGNTVVSTTAPTSTTQTVIRYIACAATANATSATGYYIGYWDYTSLSIKYMVGGTQTAASATADACTTGVKSTS